MVALVAGLAVRCWQVAGRAAEWKNDSDAYLEISTLPLLSGERWVSAPRTPLVPLLLDLTGGRPGTVFMYLQVVLAAAGWALLAGEVAQFQPSQVRRWAAAGLVLALSLTTPITLWDRLVLTESITLALMAIVIALVLRHLRTGRSRPLVLVVPVAVAWAAGRDTVAVVLLVGAALAVGAWVRSDRRSKVVPAVSAVLVVVAGLSVLTAAAGHRDRLPLANVFSVRVFPYPERIDWFEQHGMPEADRFRSARVSLVEDPAVDPPVVLIARYSPDDPWWQWLERDGRATFVRFVLSHPTYLLTEPLEVPHRSSHSSGGHTGANFAAPDLRTVPLLTSLLWWPTGEVIVILLAAAATWAVAGRPRNPLFPVAALVAVCGAAYGFVAWHGDGMEAARHVFVGSAALRVALVLAVAGVAATWPVRRAREP